MSQIFCHNNYLGQTLDILPAVPFDFWVFPIELASWNFANWFSCMQIIFWIWNRVHFDRSKLDLSDETIRIQNFYFSRHLWWKNCWKLTKSLRCQKAHSFQTVKRYWFQILIAYIVECRLEWRLCKNFTSVSYILSKKKAVKKRYYSVGSGRFMVLNDTASLDFDEWSKFLLTVIYGSPRWHSINSITFEKNRKKI